jgi:DNA-binding response OmpR family regulator
MGARVLLVEDESAIADFLADNLRQDDHHVHTVGGLGEAVAALERIRPDVALIDVGLPDGSGFELCRQIRGGAAGNPEVGVIMLTARAEEQDRVRGFDRGADDYVVKPFHYPELLGRINALATRLGGGRRSDQLVVGPIQIDVRGRSVEVAGTALHLPAKEFDLLVALAREPFRVHSKIELLERVWGYSIPTATRTLDSHASRLRRRVEECGATTERFVINHWGVGYALRGGGQ